MTKVLQFKMDVPLVFIHISIFAEITCSDPSIQIKGSVGLLVVTSTLSIGGEAHYRCERGYSIKGNQTRTCLPKGQWSGTPPVCIRQLFFLNLLLCYIAIYPLPK